VATGRPDLPFIAFPAHALLIVEERLREQEAEGIRMPEGMPLDELALRVLTAAVLSERLREWERAGFFPPAR
jgi:hypothetical protein